MPGIFGFTHPARTPATERALDQMRAALHDEPIYRAEQHQQNRISLGRVGLTIVQDQPQPAWDEARNLAVVMEGEIYDYAQQRARLEQRGHRFATNSHAELLAHCYEEDGSAFAAHLNGAFAAALWDEPNSQLTLTNDHLGLMPLYYTPALKDGFGFASGVRALLALPDLPRRVNRLTMAEFLTFDHPLHDHTLLEDVKLLPPASTLVVNDRGWHLERYWQPRYPAHYAIRGEGDYRAELLERLRAAVRRQLPNGKAAAILMSGGLDSRVIAALLHEQRGSESIATFTMGQPGCDDERFGTEVSHALGMPHRFYHLRGEALPEYVARGVRLSDGMGNAVHMHTLSHLSDQAGRAQIFYKGFLGDALIGYGIPLGLWANFEEGLQPQAQFAGHLEQGLILFDSKQLDDLMPAEGGESLSRWVMESYAQALRDSGAVLPADQRNYFDIYQRVPRMTLHGVEWVRSLAHVRLPFADRELVSFMFQVPPAYRFNRKIIKDLFIEQFPKLAKIPYTETNYPLVHCRREVVLRANEQIRWWLRSQGLNWVGMPIKRPYARYNEWLRGPLRPWLEGILLDKRSLERGLFNPAFVRNLVAEHFGGANHYTRLGALISLELWQRQYLD